MGQSLTSVTLPARHIDMGSFKKQLIDQSAHIAAAIIFLLPVLFAPSALGAIWAGFGLGYMRELTELGNPVYPKKMVLALVNSKLDLAFWALGGALTFFLSRSIT